MHPQSRLATTSILVAIVALATVTSPLLAPLHALGHLVVEHVEHVEHEASPAHSEHEAERHDDDASAEGCETCIALALGGTAIAIASSPVPTGRVVLDRVSAFASLEVADRSPFAPAPLRAPPLG